MIRALCVLVAASTTAACARDANARADSSANVVRVTRTSDAGIMATLAAINVTEIEAARMAQTRASSADVRALATQIVRDHTALQDSVAAVGRDGVDQTVDAAAIRARGRSLLDTLARLSGQAFDLMYVDAQVSDHQMALQAIGAWQSYADHARVRERLRMARPVVQAHYDHAQALLAPLISGGESSVWKKHLGQPIEASGTPPNR